MTTCVALGALSLGFTGQIAGAAAAKAPSVVGGWQVNVSWTKGPATGTAGTFNITFNRGGTFVTPATGDTGTWRQHGNHLSFRFSADGPNNPSCTSVSVYKGTWHQATGEFAGTQKTTCANPSSGVWNMPEM